MCSTRSIRDPSPTATLTVWATSPASSSISTTSNGSAWTASGSHPSRSRPTPTGGTTSRTSAPSHPSSARCATSIGSSPRRGSAASACSMDIVPNHTSEQHPWFVDVAVVAHRRPPGLVRVGRRQGGRAAAEQLGQQLRRSRVDTRRGDRAVLLPQPPGGAARPQLVERGRCGTRSTTSSASGPTGAWPGSASTSATSSSRTPSSATTRRPPRTTTSRRRCSGSAACTTPTGPRCTR